MDEKSSIEFGGYKIVDRRGVQNAPAEDPCRVCGAPTPHSKTYGNPTMDCIKFLRQELKDSLHRWVKEPTVENANRCADNVMKEFFPIDLNYGRIGVRTWAGEEQAWYTYKLPAVK